MAILFRSTNREAPLVDFEQALLQGQAPDRGLYMPERIPHLERKVWEELKGASYVEIARRILGPYLEGFIEDEELAALLHQAYDFPVPLEKVSRRRYLLRLDRGPTLSFKDFAARLMARLMAHALRRRGGSLCILTATSGDTGGAVANAFHGFSGIRVIVLFPLEEITFRQRLQMTTLGENVVAVGVEGKFDDCQRLVKEAFADPELSGLNLTSANSINFGRLLPQAVYYAFAYLALAREGTVQEGEPVVFAVPCGNFGNLVGGVLAWRMGLPVHSFVVGVNSNDEFPRYLQTGRYEKIEPSRKCISSAMNVGHPSNLARLVDLYGGHMDHTGAVLKDPDLEALRRDFPAISVDDDTCRRTMKQVWEKEHILLEPHGAVAWYALSACEEKFGKETVEICLETAHPAKFPEEVTAQTGQAVPVPPQLARLERREESFLIMQPEYELFKGFLLEELSRAGA